MNNKLKKFLPLVLALLVLGGFLYYLNQTGKFGGNKTDANNSITITPTEIEASKNGESFTIKIKPVAKPAKVPEFDYLPDSKGVAAAFKNPEVEKLFMEKFAKIIENLKTDPNNMDSWVSLGVARKVAGDYKAAEEAYWYAAWLRPGSVPPFFDLADLYHYYTKDYVKAAEAYRTVINNDPWNIQAYTDFSEMLVRQGKIKEAEEILLAGVKRNGSVRSLLVVTGDFYKSQGQNAKAIPFYERALIEARRNLEEDMANDIEAQIMELKTK